MNKQISKTLCLEDDIVRLEPLTLEHTRALYDVSLDDAIWRYMPVPMPQSPADTEAWIQTALHERDRETALPFAIHDCASDRIVGSTRYLDIQPENQALEIGWTWITPSAQRTGINTHMKFLMLSYAFEEWGAVRVQLKGDMRNLKSRAAIERLGAVFEGALRKQRACWDGHTRDTFYYSILNDEWPRVRENLAGLMQQKRDVN